MRPIDADALLERYGEPCHSFRDVIEDMPTLDVAPTVHGEWIINDIVVDNNGRTMPDWPMCSKCRQKSDLEWDYCPRCGAKMDGDNDE